MSNQQPSGTHLFGDVYWNSSRWTTVLILLSLPFLLVSFEQFVRWFPEFGRWLLYNHTDVFRFLANNWTSIGLFALGAAVATGIDLRSGPNQGNSS